MAFGAADSASATHSRRIALLIDEGGKILRIYDPAGTGKFPAQVLSDIKKEEL